MLWHEFCTFINVKRLWILGVFVIMLSCIFAQESALPQRTPEEEAMKQTEMLQRELNLTEQQHDTIYVIHLKYARRRRESNTRQEALERLNSMTEDILQVLTPEQRSLFLNKQVSWHARHQIPRVPRPNDFVRTVKVVKVTKQD